METQVALHCLFGFAHGSERWRMNQAMVLMLRPYPE